MIKHDIAVLSVSQATLYDELKYRLDGNTGYVRHHRVVDPNIMIVEISNYFLRRRVSQRKCIPLSLKTSR